MADADAVIRLARPDEVEAIVVVRREAILALAPTRASRDEVESWAQRPDRRRRCLASIEAGRLRLVELDADPVGWLEMHDAFVSGLYVAPRQWKRGHGKRLMAFAEKTIVSEGFPEARLNAGRTAVDFYLQLGYAPTGPAAPGHGTPMAKRLMADAQASNSLDR